MDVARLEGEVLLDELDGVVERAPLFELARCSLIQDEVIEKRE